MFEKYGFDYVTNNSKRKTLFLLKRKKKKSIEIVKKTINEVVLNNKIIFMSINRIILFGSLVKGTNGYNSDIDLLIELKNYDPLIKQLLYLFGKEIEKKIEQIPDVTIMMIGEKSRFLDWVQSYGVEVYSSEK